LTGASGAHNTGSGLTGSSGYGHNDPSGPHDSHALNRADPRVDSDRYGAAGNTSGAGGVGAGQYGSSTGTHNTGNGLTGSSGHGRNDPTGPHSSHLANTADPRVDSDRYGSAGNTSGAGGVGAGQYTEGYGNVGGTSGGIGGTSGGLGGGHGNTQGTNTGLGSGSAGGYDDGTLPKALTEDVSKAQPHSALQGDQHATGTHGTHGNQGTHGKPSMMDKLNPKKDADGDGKTGFMK
jgi:hypothetical protein